LKSPLLIAGIAAIVVLLAGMIAPYLIDWNAHRAAVEAQLQQLTGRKTTVGGDIKVRLFPLPTVHLADVRVGNVEGAAEPYFLTIQDVSARLMIGSLVSGQARVTSIDLEEPVINAEVLRDGSVNWRTDGVFFGRLIGAEAISLEHAAISGGVVRFRDARSEVVVSVTGIDAAVTARSLAGPLTAEGTATVMGLNCGFRIALGSPGEAAGQRLGVRTLPACEGGARASLEGRIVADTGFSGVVSLNSGPPIKPVELRGASPDTPPAPAHVFTARLQASATSLVLDEISYRASGKTLLADAGGRAEIGLLGTVRLDAAITSRVLDIDALGAAADDRANPVLDLAAALIRRVGDGALTVDLPSLRWRGEHLRDVRLAVDFDSDGFTLKRVSAVLGNGGTMAMSGTARGRRNEAGWLSFDGRVDVVNAGIEGALALAGLERSLATYLDEDLRLRAATFKARIGLDGDRVALPQIEARAGAARVAGAIQYRPQGRGLLKLDLDVADLNLARAPDGFLSGERLADRLMPDFGIDIEADIAARNVRIGATSAARLEFTAKSNKDRFKLEKAGYSTGADSRIEGTANVARSGDTLKGTYQVAIVGKAGPVAADVLKMTGRSGLLAPVNKAIAGFKTLSLTLKANAESAGETVSARLETAGMLGTSRLNARGSFSGKGSDWKNGTIDGTVEIANEASAVLFDELGWGKVSAPSKGLGPGLVRLSAKGRPASDLALAAGLEGFGAQATATGNGRIRDSGLALEAETEFKAGDPTALYAALGMAAVDSAARSPVDLKAAIAGSGREYVISNLTGHFAGTALNINGTVDLSGARPVFKLKAGFDTLVLGDTLAYLFVKPASKQAAESGSPNAARRFDFTVLDRFDLDIDAAARAIELAPGVGLTDARLVAAIDAHGVQINKLTGTYQGGKTEIVALAERKGDAVAIDARVDVAGAGLSKIVRSRKGGELIRGKLSLAGRFKMGGRSLASLIPSLNGQGNIEIAGGALQGVNPRTFGEALLAARSEVELDALIKGILAEGEMVFLVADGRFTVANGLVRLADMMVEGEGARAELDTMIELESGKLDSEWRLTLAGFPSAPPLTVVYAGPFTGLTKCFDAEDLKAYLVVKSLKSRIDELDGVKPEAAN